MSVGYPHVRVEGGPRERGRQYGEQARERVRRSVDAYREIFAAVAGLDWERARDEARRFERPIADFDPRYLEEIGGVAEGAALERADVLALNIRTEVMLAAAAREAERTSVGECTAFAVLPEASRDGETLVGQNWDWLPHVLDTVVVLEAHPADGPSFVTVVEAGLLAKCGFNAAGLALMTNTLVTAADRGEPAVPYHVLLRALLDCATLPDALAALQRRPRSSSANYLLAHESGLAVSIEAAPGDFSRLFLVFPERGVLLHANHFLSPAFDGKDVSLWAMPDSPFRLERLRTAVELDRPELSADSFVSALADHASHPAGICCHPDPRRRPHEQGVTGASVIVELGARRLWLAEGPPCTAPFRALDLAGSFAGVHARS